MVKIIVAFANDEKSAHYSAVLEEAGVPVFRRCTSGSEVRRALNQYDDSIVICASRLTDCTADELAWDMDKRALMLVLGRAEQLDNCEHPDIFRLKVPCSRGELTSAVNMLVQLHQMKMPRRSPKEDEIIQKAKEYLMLRHSMSEAEAHHCLQKGAMNRGLKLTEYASQVLKQI